MRTIRIAVRRTAEIVTRRERESAARQRAARAGARQRSAASSWSKPPIDWPSITIWGNVTMPVTSWSLLRPSGSRARLISS